MVFFYILLIFILGLVIGSFIGAYTYRLPEGIDIKKGGSFCPHCHKNLAWYDNIPLISYFLLNGKCRHCKKNISPRYPLIEAATALGFVGVYYLQRPFFETLLFLFVFSILIAIFVIDLEYQIIPDNLVFILLITVYWLLLTEHFPTFYLNLATGFGSALFLLLVHLITSGRGMGLGDVKFALFAGTFLGWPNSLTWLFGAFLIGAVTGIALILAKRASFKKPIPFGPFLIISFIITVIWGEKLGLYVF